MNKIKIIVIVFLLGIFYSCDDAIDITQPGLLEYQNLYKTVADLQDGLSGVYIRLDNSNEIRFNAVYSDEISIGVGNGGQAKLEYGLVLDSNSTSPFSIWTNNIIALDRINRVLEASANVIPSLDEQDQYDNILGQLHAMRAYVHFVLQTYFTEDLTDDTKLGSVIMNQVFLLDNSNIPRKKNAEVFAFIEAEIQMAESLIQDSNGVTYFGKDVLKALKARMYSYRGMYDLAEPLAIDLLSTYPLANQTKFAELWSDVGDNTGVIFKLERTREDRYDRQGTGMEAGGQAGTMFSFGMSGGIQSIYLEVGRSLFNLIDPLDVRYNTYIDHNSSIIDPNYTTSPNVIQSDVLAVGKYLGSESQTLMNDLKIFRSAEMLFLIAEARADAGDYNAVSALLKQLKDERLNTSTPLISISNDEEAFAAILQERRVELCLEGFRWVDLKRLGNKANVQIDRDPRDCEAVGVCTMSNNDHRFTLPIPLSELDNNNNLIQNTGY